MAHVPSAHDALVTRDTQFQEMREWSVIHHVLGRKNKNMWRGAGRMQQREEGEEGKEWEQERRREKKEEWKQEGKREKRGRNGNRRGGGRRGGRGAGGEGESKHKGSVVLTSSGWTS